VRAGPGEGKGETVEQPTAAPFVPATTDLEKLREAAAGCRGCHLHADATQTVFGAGAPDARIMMVGEQPGDIEDRRGAPFVGPAGKLLDRALDEAGLDRGQIYVTNAVKHFKHEVRGKRRIHQRPTTAEINACQPWLAAELEAVAGTVVVALGATAARALFGKTLGIASNRGRPLPLGERLAFVTYHPSAVLRGDERADELRAALVDDLAAARQAVGSTPERVVTTDG
jgi:uracil-DNA glycosylase